MAKILSALFASILAALLLVGCQNISIKDQPTNSSAPSIALEAGRLLAQITPKPDSTQPAIAANTASVAAPSASPAPIATAVYGPIYAEARTADWRHVGIDPARYVAARLHTKAFLTPLLNGAKTRVVLHRQAIKISQVPGIHPSHTRNVSHPDAKDYPGRVYWSPDDRAFHIVAIAGEDWFRQTLHMLATAGVPIEKITVEGMFAPAALVAADLDPTLAAHAFDSVTVGPMGELVQAIERVLRQRERPAYAQQMLARMAALLEERMRQAPPDKKPSWATRLQRLQALCSPQSPALEQITRIKADTLLSGPLANLIHAAEEGPPRQQLPWSFSTRNADVLAHRVVTVDGKKHLLIHIGGAHGDMAYHAIRHVLAKQPTLGRVNVYGSAGSFSTAIPPDTFIIPTGTFRSLEEDRGTVLVSNQAALDGAIAVRHANVSTLLREHRAGLQRLVALPADSVDIESYHVARAVSEAGRPVDFRAILRVSDVATSPELGAHRVSRARTSHYDVRRDGEERVVYSLGLLAAPLTTQ